MECFLNYLSMLWDCKTLTIFFASSVFILGWIGAKLHASIYCSKETKMNNLILCYYLFWFVIFLILTIIFWQKVMIFKPFSGYSLIFVMFLLFIILPFVKELDICGVKANFDFFQKGKQLDKKEQQTETRDLITAEKKSINNYNEELKKLLEKKKPNLQGKRGNFHV